MVKISVIIPAYNGDRYLGEAIDSVLGQTYRDYEIIVVDDGSIDNTAQVAQQYGDCGCEASPKDSASRRHRVRYLSQRNQGVAASRNLGLAAALGDYIAFLDQDDVFLPHKLAEQVELLDRDAELGIVNSGWQICQDNETSQPSKKAAVQPWQQIPDLTAANLIIWKPVFLGAMLFRRDWLERAGGFDTRLEQTPDVELVMRLAKMGCPAAWVEQITVKYRQHEDNASKNSLLQAQELNQITANFFSDSNDPAIATLEAQSRYQSLIWSAWRLHETGYLTEMSDYLRESRAYSSKYPTEIPLNWLEAFQNYSAEYGKKFNLDRLISSSEWQSLLHLCMF